MSEDNLGSYGLDELELNGNGVDFDTLKMFIFQDLSHLSPLEIAGYFMQGDEDNRILYREYVRAQTPEYQKEFTRHLEDLTKEPIQRHKSSLWDSEDGDYECLGV